MKKHTIKIVSLVFIQIFILGNLAWSASLDMIDYSRSIQKYVLSGKLFIDNQMFLQSFKEGNISSTAIVQSGMKQSLSDGTIGLIGVGKHGKRHLRHLVDQGVNVLAVDGLMDMATFEEFGKNKLVTLAVEDADRIFNDSKINAVIIATPGKTHYELTKKALLAGKNVLVEKPFTRNISEAKELVALAKERNLILMVGHNRSYLPHYQRLQEIVQSGKLGKILEVEGNYLNPPQKFDITHTALEGLGYHQFYMIHGVLGVDHPDELLSAVSSEDKETVGIRLKYGDVPVTVRLSRKYDGEKKRNLIVKGSKYTAIFDYTKEPAETALRFELTPSIMDQRRAPELVSQFKQLPLFVDDSLVINNETEDSETLNELQKMSILTGSEDTRPSLHFQLKVFRDTLLTKKTPLSSGASAVSVVEILEQIRNKLGDSGLYLVNSPMPSNDIIELADLIHDRIGERGGIVTIDGASAVGKTSFAKVMKDVYEFRYPTKRVVDYPLDESMKPWVERAVMKKLILGESLTDEEIIIAKKNFWLGLQESFYSDSEHLLWDGGKIRDTLTELRAYFDNIDTGQKFEIINQDANIKINGTRIIGTTRRSVSHNEVVFVEGKYSNSKDIIALADVAVRIKGSQEDIRKRFKKERAFLGHEELSKHMLYYDLLCYPTWKKYEEDTQHLLNAIFEVNITETEGGSVNYFYSREDKNSFTSNNDTAFSSQIQILHMVEESI